MSKKRPFTDQEALLFHAQPKPGKIEIIPSKPMDTQRDLALAYSPGVAVPVRAIAEDPSTVYDYTVKGNLVAVISNGTAILGLGDLGALASKPVMEGKAVLFKRFADVDSIDLEVETSDVDEFVNCVRFLGATFGGINLEDIKAPDCFIIEQRLREVMSIPVFHDDQHGTAIITAAGLINALRLTGRDIKKTTMVVNGAGAAGIACLELIKAMGMPNENAILCDTKGVIYKGRVEGMNQWKSAHAATTKARTLAEALVGADVFLGLSVKDAVTQAMVKSMAAKPIIFACANPDPEITPEDVAAVRSDAIVATGRSDYPNQVNNVLGFPYIFRGALDVRARTINDAMKIAAANALAELAREDVPDEVAAAYHTARPKFGPDYIIPVPFDPRLISRVPMAVAKAAMESGVARKPIADMGRYGDELESRLDPIASIVQRVVARVRTSPKSMVFAEGEEEAVIRAALSYQNSGLGKAILIGNPERIHNTARQAGVEDIDELEIQFPRESPRTHEYTEALYKRWQRQGSLYRDCLRQVNYDRNIFAASVVAAGHADAMVTGVTRHYSVSLSDVRHVLDTKPGERVMGVSIVLEGGRTVFVADTTVHEMPSSEELVDITIQTAAVARRFGYEPRVALLAYSTFGQPWGERSQRVREAIELLDKRSVDFEYDGEMNADVALDPARMARYPFCRLKGPANVLIMPAIHSASISTTMTEVIGGATVIGPLLVGLSKPVQIAPLGASMNDHQSTGLVSERWSAFADHDTKAKLPRESLMLNIHLVPCLKDNYAYLVHEPSTNSVGVVDPSEAPPVFAALKAHGLKLTHILNTHHHFDHTGGNLALKEATGARIVGPRADRERIPGIDEDVGEGDVWSLGNAKARIFDIPAHTKGHIAFWFEADKAVFTGDTMFAMGCGRLFEGTPAQMWSSLSKLAALPPETRVYCGHEYTLSNGKFAITLEPNNAPLRNRLAEVERLRAEGKPTIPSTIGLERETNPFLRAESKELRKTLGLENADNVAVLAETRRRKDTF